MENVTKSTRLSCDISSEKYINRGVVIARLSLVCGANDYGRFFEMRHIFDSVRSGIDIVMFPRTGRHTRNSKNDNNIQAPIESPDKRIESQKFIEVQGAKNESATFFRAKILNTSVFSL